MTKYFTKEQVMNAMGEQNLMLDDIWGVEQRLDELLAANVAPVVYGRWIDDDCAFMRCSLCGYENDWEWATLYCPNCGARMDGGESNA